MMLEWSAEQARDAIGLEFLPTVTNVEGGERCRFVGLLCRDVAFEEVCVCVWNSAILRSYTLDSLLFTELMIVF